MNGRTLYEALGFVDPEMVERACAPFTRHRRWRRWFLTAACVGLLLAGTAVAGEALLGVSIVDIFTGKTESRYHILAGAREFEASDFSSPALDEALQAAQQQYADFKPWDSRIPGWQETPLDTWEACEDFLGRDVFNPLEGAEGLTMLDSNACSLEAPSQGSTSHCEAQVYADEEGNLGYASLRTAYQSEACKVTLQVDFYLKDGAVGQTSGYIYDGEVEFSTQKKTLPSGQEALLVQGRWEASKYSAVEAYFVCDGAFYSLRVWQWAPEKPEEERLGAVEETMESLLALF